MNFDPVSPIPKSPTPGRAGDFHFLTGEWRIHNRSIVNGAWLEYPGEATVYEILGGIGSVEELRIPARNFSGMWLRMLAVEEKIWSDRWVNAKSGVLTCPGQTGSFEGGAGIFFHPATRTTVARCYPRVSGIRLRRDLADGGKQ